MKITVALTIEVDPANWATYSQTGSAKVSDVREEIRDYVLYAVQLLPRLDDASAEVALKV